MTFGLTTLFIGHLNLLSVTFAPMLLGLGIDYAIHWFARYGEVRTIPFASTKKALAATMDKVGPAILLAGLCASLSFFPLVLTGFKGLSELGLICAMGLAVTTAATLYLLPALIVLFDRFRIGLAKARDRRDEASREDHEAIARFFSWALRSALPPLPLGRSRCGST